MMDYRNPVEEADIDLSRCAAHARWTDAVRTIIGPCPLAPVGAVPLRPPFGRIAFC
jgi:hypothetical protein